MPAVNDVIIIGGGAAGLCAAAAIKKAKPSLSVRMLEQLPRVGKKLAATGNGRCNITNKNININRYHGVNKDFCNFALEKYGTRLCESFFNEIGVNFVFEGEKAYPSSLQAASVVDCLRFAADEAGVIVNTDTRVTNIQLSGGKYKVIAGNMNFLADNVIIAAGLMSGGEKYGSTGEMLALLKKSGFKTVKTTPSLVQIKTENSITKQLKGIKTDACVSLIIDGETVKTEKGEVLFCDYGLSGPPILQISRKVSRTDRDCFIELDLMPESGIKALTEVIVKRALNLADRPLEEFFTGMLNKRIGQVIIKSVGLSLSEKTSCINKKIAESLAKGVKNMRFKVTGTTGFPNSQATAGGLDTTQFNRETMMAYQSDKLYAVGEILDIDGDCGGFNLQWAWSSALCAADAITNGEVFNAYNK